jgi:maleylacetate reductase
MVTQGRYDFLDQDSIIFGTPAAQAVVDVVEKSGAQRVFLLTSKTLSRKTDEIDRIRQALGSRYAGIFDECVAHVPRESVLRAAQAVRQANPDLIVTVGGGTPIDTAKVLQICLAQNVKTEQELGEYRIRVLEDGTRHIPKIAPSPVRQIVVPTTLSGAEFSCLGGCSDMERQVKDIYTSPDIGAKAVILDPAVTVHTPEWLWLSTGVRAVDHAVETVCSRKPQPFTDATCLHGLKMLDASLRTTKVDPSNLQARLDSQVGVWLASTGLGRIEWGASHGIGHQLGAVADVPHGHTSCVMLHNVMRYNRSVNADRQALISEALGRPNDDAADLIESLVRDLGMPTRLSDVGVTPEHFDAIARGGMENMMVRTNPRPIRGPEDIKEILQAAL